MPPAGPGESIPVEGWYGPGMSILNRRNAVVGWAVTKVAKRVVKKKAADVTPSARTGGAAAGALAALGGALLFWKKRSGGNAE
jgi:hypothetical protein